MSPRSVNELLVRPLEIIEMSEGSEPARSAGEAAVTYRMEALDAPSERLKALVNEVAVAILDPTVYIDSHDSGPVAIAPIRNSSLRNRELILTWRGTCWRGTRHASTRYSSQL